MSVPSKEGEIPFDVPAAGKPCHTWYKVFGDLESSSQVPLIVLHGGPGACHEYLLNHSELAAAHGTPVIFYDQLGNGKSTRLREKAGDEKFWVPSLFIQELDNVISTLGLREKGFDIVGQSWGGMLAAEYAVTRPKGLRRVIISSSPASSKAWSMAARQLVSKLPADVQETLKKCEEAGDTDSKEYEEAMNVFYAKHLCNIKPFPAPEAAVGLAHLVEDPTTYGTMWGPSEIFVTGNLRDWDITGRLGEIDVPVLLVNGADDEAQHCAVAPFFKGLRKVKWVTIDGASHFVHMEKKQLYFQILSEFLLDKDL